MEAKRSPYEPHWSCLVCMRRHSVHICGSEWCAVVALGTIELHDSTHSPSSCCSGVNPHWDLPWRRSQPFGKLSLLVAWWRACGTVGPAYLWGSLSPPVTKAFQIISSQSRRSIISACDDHSAVTGGLCLEQLSWKQVGSTDFQQHSEKWQDKKHGRGSKQSRMGARKNLLNLILPRSVSDMGFHWCQ